MAHWKKQHEGYVRALRSVVNQWSSLSVARGVLGIAQQRFVDEEPVVTKITIPTVEEITKSVKEIQRLEEEIELMEDHVDTGDPMPVRSRQKSYKLRHSAITLWPVPNPSGRPDD